VVRNDSEPAAGLTTEIVKFESVPDIPIPFRCPACRKMHNWRPITAWVDKNRRHQRARLVVQGRN
jgi:hypothetical protein